MTERESFEAWAHKAHYNLGVGPNGLYQSGRTSSAWASWQAARAQPAQAVPVVTEQEIVKCLTASGCVGTIKMSYDSGPYEITRTSINADRFARLIEQAVRAKMGVAVPMPGDQIFRIARRLAPKVIDGMVYVPEWIVPLVRAVEESHGIVGKEGV